MSQITAGEAESIAKVFGHAFMKTTIYVSPFIISMSIASVTIPLQSAVLSDATMETYFASAAATVLLSLLMLPLIATAIIVVEKMSELSLFS